MPVINKKLLIPFIVGGPKEEGETPPPTKEAVFNFGTPGKERIEETWFIRNYDLYDTNGTQEEKALIKNQRHVDIRTFATDAEEGWDLGLAGPSEAMEGLSDLTLSVTTGMNTATSIASQVNLRDEFTPQDFIILALPDFPLASVKTNESTVEFTSHPEGDFTAGPTVAIKFSQSESSLIEGDSEFKISRSLIEKNELDIALITGVRIKIKATGSATVTVAGLRLVSQDWTYSPIDFDNWNGRWAPPVPPNGSLSHSLGYSSQPILWRSVDPPGPSDPRFIDSRFGLVFNTGTQENSNAITLYLREVSEAFLTQVDLDGLSMAELDRRPQPDLGISEFSPRQVGSLDSLPMSELDDQEVDDLERIEDPTFQSWISFTINWGNSSQIVITNSAETGYNFTHAGLANNTDYIALVSLEGTGARLTIYPLNPDSSINPASIFDSTLIKDSGIFKRQKGRVGWKADLEDNQAFIGAIQPRGITFAEYVSSPLKSRTPVGGAQLFASYTSNEELFSELALLPSDEETTLLARDQGRTLSGSSYRVTNNGGSGQGVQTNTFALTDLSQSGISFDLWYPAHLPPIKASLVNGQKAVVPVTLPFLYSEQWQHIKINLSDALVPSGQFILVFEQPEESVGIWWLDNVSIFQRAVQWSARSVADDPWDSNDAPWTDFREIVNGKGDVQFSVQGRELQFRAKARQQEAVIAGPPQIRPRYAQLGRLVWPEEAAKTPEGEAPSGPEAEFTFSKSSPTVTLELVKFPKKPDEFRGDLAISSSNIFWGDEPVLEEEAFIRKGPIAGGAGGTLVTSNEEHEFVPRGLATDSTYVYFGHGKHIARVKLDGTGLEFNWIVLPALSVVEGVAVDSNYIYWVDKKHKVIGRAKKSNPSEERSENFIEGILQGGDLAVNSAGLFWVSNDNVIKYAKLDGTGSATFYSRPGHIRGLAATSTGLIWSYTESGLSGIGKANNEGGEIIPEFVTGELSVGGLAASGEFVYWVNGEAISRASLGTNPLEGRYTDTSTPGSSPIVLREWDFGDGFVGLGTSVSHVYGKKGTYTVTLTVVDSFGLRASYAKEVTVG